MKLPIPNWIGYLIVKRWMPRAISNAETHGIAKENRKYLGGFIEMNVSVERKEK